MMRKTVPRMKVLLRIPSTLRAFQFFQNWARIWDVVVETFRRSWPGSLLELAKGVGSCVCLLLCGCFLETEFAQFGVSLALLTPCHSPFSFSATAKPTGKSFLGNGDREIDPSGGHWHAHYRQNGNDRLSQRGIWSAEVENSRSFHLQQIGLWPVVMSGIFQSSTSRELRMVNHNFETPLPFRPSD